MESMFNDISNWTKYGSDTGNITWEREPFAETHGRVFYIQLGINLAGIVGNVLVIIAHFMGGFFLVSVNDFVLTLACSDLLAAILLLPLPRFHIMPDNFLGTIYCVFCYQETLFWICIKASIFFIMTIALESAAAVRRPHVYKKIYCNKGYRRLIVVTVCIVAFFSNIHHYFTDCVTEEGECVGILAHYPCDNKFIGDQDVSKAPNPWVENTTSDYVTTESDAPLVNRTDAILISLYVYCSSYILPLVVMVTAYALTAERLRQNMKNSGGRNTVFARARHRIIGVVMIDIIVFFVCVTPNEIMWLIQAFNKDPGWHIKEYLEIIDGILLSIYVCANPIIYTATNPQFRLILRKLFRRPVRRKSKTYRTNISRHDTSGERSSRSVRESTT